MHLLAGLLLLAAEPDLTGVLNFRDVGGVPTQSGRAVAHGMIFRSGELNTLTEADKQALSALHIKAIFDLRTPTERAAAKTQPLDFHPKFEEMSVGFADPNETIKLLFARGMNPAQVAIGMQQVTAKIAIDGAREIGQVLRLIAQGEYPALIHCTAGKDRTGVTVALLLTTLGVPKEAIYRDYLRSNEYIDAHTARLKGMAASLPPEVLKVIMGVDATYLDAAFSAIDGRFGSFDAYIASGLQLKPEDVAALRGRLLEPAR